MKRGIWWASFLVCSSALAQEGARFQYIAPPECPSEEQFRELVRARLLDEPPASEHVSVEVRLDPARRRATLSLEEPNRSPVERVVEGDSCEELASGLALITALAFGTGRETAAPEPPVAATASPPPTPASAAATTPPVEAATIPPKPPRPLAIETGLGGWVNTWSAPSAMWGADLFLRLSPKARHSWSVRAAGVYGFGAANVGDRRAEFRFLGGRAEGCPLVRDNFEHRLAGEACLALEMGALHGSGQASSALPEASSDTVLSATALITGRIRARLGRRIFVEGQGDLGVPLLHHEFVFEQPDERIFRIPAVGFSARLGLGVQFP